MLNNLIKDAFGTFQNLLVSEPQHSEALRDHVRVAVLVMMPLLVRLMHWSVALND